jgi:galactarate dehydratase
MRAPLYIRTRDEDNVSMAANRGGLDPGAVFADSLQPIEQIPQGHKVAIAADGVIRRYGEVMGYALRPIARGS